MICPSLETLPERGKAVDALSAVRAGEEVVNSAVGYHEKTPGQARGD